MRSPFDTRVLPHLDAAYNYARWLSGSDADAARVTEAAVLAARPLADSLPPGDARAWLLAIVRRTWSQDAPASPDTLPAPPDRRATWPAGDIAGIDAALARLPVGYREMLVLRDVEALHYRDIAQIAGIAPATVMTRLEAARQMLATTVAMLGKEAA